MFAGRPRGLINYVNLPPMLGMVVSAKLATLHELQTVYGVRDLFDMAEVICVDARNRQEIIKNADNHR